MPAADDQGRLRSRHDVSALTAGAELLRIEEGFIRHRDRIEGVVADDEGLLVQQVVAGRAEPLEPVDFAVAAIATLALRIMLHLVLVPSFGLAGACMAILLSEVLLVAVCMTLLHRHGLLLDANDIPWRQALAAFVVSAIVLTLPSASLWLIPGVGMAAMVYLALTMMLRTFTAQELEIAAEGAGILSSGARYLRRRFVRDS